MRRTVRLALLGGLLVVGSGALRAQTPTSGEETRVLREAAGLEWRGRIGDAETLLEDLLERRPGSSAGLFALERVLRTQGRVGEVLPWADRYLDEDPSSSAVRYMKLRVLVEVDSLGALPEEAEAWFEAEPDAPDPYREVARLYQRSLGDQAALDLLDQGQRRLSDPSSLAWTAGDVRQRMGDDVGAAREWGVGLRAADADLAAARRRIRGLEGDGTVLAPPLLEGLAAVSSPERRAAAAEVALHFGLSDRALELTREAADAYPEAERAAFLRRIASGAEEEGEHEVAIWALEEARRMVPERDRAALDLQLAALALQAGDTARATAAQDRVARRLPAGSVERRRVLAELIRVQAPTAPPAQLSRQLQDFESEFPDAPEADELRAAVAAGLAGRGRIEEARSVAAEGGGPLSGLEEGYLRFQEGDLAGGSEVLQDALPALAPSRATEVLHLLSSLTRVGPGSAAPLAEAAALAHQGRPSEGAGILADALPEAPDADRPTLLSWAGELAGAAGESARAAEFYAALLDGYPQAPEIPDAALALAEIHLAEGRSQEARTVLEQLILARPDSPVAPAARRALQRIRGSERGSEANEPLVTHGGGLDG